MNKLRNSFQKHKNIRENYGPEGSVKTEGGRVISKSDMDASHDDHIHVTGQR